MTPADWLLVLGWVGLMACAMAGLYRSGRGQPSPVEEQVQDQASGAVPKKDAGGNREHFSHGALRPKDIRWLNPHCGTSVDG